MSRERHLRKLGASLRESQHILGELIAGTSHDASKRLDKANRKLQRTYDEASTELSGYLKDASKDFQKQYDSTAKDVEKQLMNSRRELEKRAALMKDQISDRYADTKAAAKAAKTSLGAGALALAAKADLPSRTANVASFLAKTGLAAKAAGFVAKTGLAAKAASLVANTDIKSRTANLLEGAATSFASARNRLNPDDRLIIQRKSDRRRVSRAGYFVRFAALAVIIISKRKQLMALGTQLYNKLKDSEGRAELTNDAREQFDTFRRLIRAYSNGQYREFPYKSLVKIVAAVIYFVSVADLIPDFIPVIGYTDDIAILAWVFASVKDDLQQFVDWEAAEEKRRERLDKQSAGNKSGTGTTTGSSVANVGSAAAPDRSPSPAVTTTTGDSGSKATVTTGSSGSSASSAGSTTGGSTTGGSGSSTTSGSAGGSSSAGGSGSSSGGNLGQSSTGSPNNSGNRPGASPNQA